MRPSRCDIFDLYIKTPTLNPSTGTTKITEQKVATVRATLKSVKATEFYNATSAGVKVTHILRCRSLELSEYADDVCTVVFTDPADNTPIKYNVKRFYDLGDWVELTLERVIR